MRQRKTRQNRERFLQREANIQAGIDELDRWLRDLMRQGLASDQVQSYQFWDDMAARMMDAQAPGLARRLRDCAGIPHSMVHGGKDWPERLLMALGKLHLLLQGYRRINHLPFSLQAELRNQIGWNQKKAEILALAGANAESVNPESVNPESVNPESVNPEGANTGGANTEGANTEGANTEGANTEGANTEGANTEGANTEGANTEGANTEGANTEGANTERAKTERANSSTVIVQTDDWQVLGVRILEEEKLWTQRIWLWGMKSDRPALLLNYAYGRPQFGSMTEFSEGTVDLVPGIVMPAELVFYPAAYPLRALVKQLTGMVKPLLSFEQGKTVAGAIADYSQALSQNPWLERMPFLLNTVIPYLKDDQTDGTKAYVIDVGSSPAQNTEQATDSTMPPTATAMGLPIHPNFVGTWEVLALSSGYPVAIAAEWDGTYIWPLSVLVEHRLVIF